MERLALIPGPKRLEALINSEAIGDIVHYSAVEVARFFQSLPDMTAIHQSPLVNGRALSGCSWRWARDERWIVVGMCLLDGVDGIVWGGSPLVCCCQAADVVALWRSTQQQFPATWIHDSFDLDVMNGQQLMEKWDALT